MPVELPIIEPFGRPERADAARNRERILHAAERLFSDRGFDCTSMDDVAAEAGVGKGTLYRRFGDRAGLARALVEAEEIPFQERLIRGEPPLGPGAPPVERLRAFGVARLDQVARYGDFFLAGDSGVPGAKYTHAAYRFYRTHVVVLLRQALPPDAPVEPLADVLMSALAAELVLFQLRGQGLTIDEIAAAWEALVEGLCGS